MREKEPSLLDNDVYEKRFTRIFSNYVFKEGFIFDVLQCLPVLIYEGYYKFSTEEEVVFEMI